MLIGKAPWLAPIGAGRAAIGAVETGQASGKLSVCYMFYSGMPL
jgi:hypothetical protein